MVVAEGLISSGTSRKFAPLLLIGTAASSVVCTLAVVVLGVRVNDLASQKTPTFVQLNGGETAFVMAKDHDERSPAVIRRYIGETMQRLLVWNGFLPQTDATKPPQKDSGYEIQNDSGRRALVATPAYQASFAIAEGFRQAWLKELADLTPQDIFGSNASVALVVKHIGQPERVQPGRWKVNFVADQLIFRRGNNLGTTISYHKILYVRAIDTPDPLSAPTETQRAINEARKLGLEIYDIQDFNG